MNGLEHRHAIEAQWHDDKVRKGGGAPADWYALGAMNTADTWARTLLGGLSGTFVGRMAAERLSYVDNFADLVFGHSILHHTDLALTRREVHRILKPGGQAVFLEPLAHNPLLRAVGALPHPAERQRKSRSASRMCSSLRGLSPASDIGSSTSLRWPLLPFVSILIPMRNEEHHIARCLDSILANDYPKDRLEILVIDGLSTDRSREIVRAQAERYPFLRVLNNPKRIAPAALNIGIQEANGEIIIRMDAHTLYAPDYIRRCVELLETAEAANVGGPQCAEGTNYISNAIAMTITTPFGIGNAHFRYAKKEMWVDTVYLGAWRKSTLEALGGFNEEWVVNEDYELNYRLRKAGGKILLSPKIKCWYYVRPSLKALAHQYFRYGFWKVKTLVAHPDSLRWRQLAPPALVVALLLSLSILPVNRMLGIAVPALYLAFHLVASIWTASCRGWKYLPLLPLVFATIHLSWGIGFLAGLFKWGIPRITLSSIVRAFQFPEGGERHWPAMPDGRWRS